MLYQDLNTPNTIICPEDNNITSVVVPDYICSIGDYSFANCEKLNEVVCGTSVDSIMLGAFKNCRNLQSVKLNSSLKNILSYAFYNCSSLEYIVIPSSVEYVGPYAFNHGTVFCDKEPRPEGWNSRCIGEMAKVYWKGEWEYNSEGIPQPINKKNSQIF